MEKIIDKLYLGSDADYKEAQSKGWSILAACKDGPNSHRSILGYTGRSAPEGKNYFAVKDGNTMALNLIDPDDPHKFRAEAVNPGLMFIKEQLDLGKTVLVHCNEGHSRGPTMTLMFLRSIGEMPSGFVQSEKKFKTLYSPYDPMQGPRQFARFNWGRLAEKGDTVNV